MFGENWEDHRWEDLQNQLERIEIDGYSNLSKTSQNDSMNDLKIIQLKNKFWLYKDERKDKDSRLMRNHLYIKLSSLKSKNQTT